MTKVIIVRGQSLDGIPEIRGSMAFGRLNFVVEGTVMDYPLS